jgi:DNA-binding MarR family transcriptional regulator
MDSGPDAAAIATTLRVSIGLLRRQLHLKHAEGKLTLPETAALARLDRLGPSTTAALARYEQISPQSMGTTIAGLEERGLVRRDPDPSDGRQMVNSVTEAGLRILRDKRNLWAEAMAKVLVSDFTSDELRQLEATVPLIERLAQRL